MTLGIILLLIAGALGWRALHDRSFRSSPAKNASSKQSTTSLPATPAFDKKRLSNDDPASTWVVVNKNRALNPLAFEPSDLVNVGNNQQLRKEAAAALAIMILDAKNQGLAIAPLSGYRSYATQVSVYNKEVAANGQTVADTESAKPGYSEHQTGLAVDVGGGGCGIEDCFGTTAEGKWLAVNAHKYGFIIRYQTGKEAVTGYRAEPWHIRYIGTELSEEMHKQNATTLEEYFNL